MIYIFFNNFSLWYKAFPEQQQIYLFFGIVIFSTVLMVLATKIFVLVVDKISKLEKNDPQRWLYHFTVGFYVLTFAIPYFCDLSYIFNISPLAERFPGAIDFVGIIFFMVWFFCVFRKRRVLFKAQEEIHGLLK